MMVKFLYNYTIGRNPALWVSNINFAPIRMKNSQFKFNLEKEICSYLNIYNKNRRDVPRYVY